MVFSIQLIGVPRFVHGDVEVVFAFRKVYALGCYISVEGRVSRETVASMFWGDKEDFQAAKNLRNALYQFKKSVPVGVLNSDRYWVWMDKSKVSVDWDVFNGLEDPEFPEIMFYNKKFMNGFFLPGCPDFMSWHRDMSINYRIRYRDFVKRFVLKKLELSRLEEALAAVKILISEDDIDEEASRLAMKCYASMGLRGKFLKVYDDLCLKLHDTLGVKPEIKTEELLNELLREPASEIVSRPVRDDSSLNFNFHGRSQEIAKISYFVNSSSKKIKSIYIYGEAGVGKSFLVKKMINLMFQDSLILSCSAIRSKNDYPLLVWNDLLENLSKQVDLNDLKLPSSMLSKLGEFFPALKVMSTSSQDISFSRLGSILAVLFEKISSNRDIVLIFEDLQWFDDASMDLLESFFVHRPGEIKIFLTSRPRMVKSDKMSFLKTELVDLCEIQLDCFSQLESVEFCREQVGDLSVRELDLSKIYHQTEGLPLFLSEMLLFIKSGRSVDDTPDSLYEAIEGHLSDLDDEERTLLECLSIFSVKAEWNKVKRMMDIDDLKLSCLSERVRARSILAECVDESSSFCLDFKHIKVKDYVYSSMSRSKRRLLHRKLSNIMTMDFSGHRWNDIECSRLIYHSRKAGMKLRVLAYTLQKLRFHIRLNYELFPLYTDELLKSSSTSFADKTYTINQLEIAKSLLRDLKAERRDDPKLQELETFFMSIKGGYHLWWGEYDQGKVLVRKALEIASSKKDCVLESECIQHLCYYSIQIEDGRLLSSYARRLIKTAGRCHNEPVKAMGLRFLGMARIYMQQYELAKKALSVSISRFKDIEALDEPYSLQIIAAESYLGDLEHRAGKLQRAYDRYLECIRECKEGNFYRGLCLFNSNAAHVAWDLGYEEEMERHLIKAYRALEERRGNSILFSLMGWMSGSRGEDMEAINFLRRADDLCIPLHKRHWLALQLYVKGLLKASVHESRELYKYLPDGAETYFKRSLDIYTKMGVIHKVNKIKEKLDFMN